VIAGVLRWALGELGDRTRAQQLELARWVQANVGPLDEPWAVGDFVRVRLYAILCEAGEGKARP
jgi:hypothetical protein